MLSSIPVIGRFATATQIGASAVSSIASLFGWTNVPVIDETRPYRPNAFPPMSSADIGYPIEKLTVDPKNELTVDPGAVGLPPVDELAVSHLVQRESYLCTTNWNTAHLTDDILFTSIVTPWMYATDGAPNPLINFLPMAFAAGPFVHWRGDVIFRFKFIASQYHKGRVRISYDPSGYATENIISDSTSSSVVFTQIIDLGKDSDIEVRVPYQQATAWLRINSGKVPWSISATPTFLHDDGFDNGTICMRVLTTLTAPVVASNIKIIVSVRGAENLEYANPTVPSTNFSLFTVQSEDVYGEPVEVLAGGSIHSPADHRYLVNFGEAIGSLRQLLRRSTLSYVASEPTDTTNDFHIVQHYAGRVPLYMGYDPNGVHSAKGLIVPASNFNYNYVFNSVYHWLAPAYIGQRGSFIWHFNTDNTTQISSVRIIRRPGQAVAAFNTSQTGTKGTVSNDSRFFNTRTEGGVSGQSLTNQFTQAGLSVGLPNYTNFKFQSTAPSSASKPTLADGSIYDGSLLEITMNGLNGPNTKGLKIWKYFSVGTDFNLFFFLNVPTYTYLSGTPAAN